MTDFLIFFLFFALSILALFYGYVYWPLIYYRFKWVWMIVSKVVRLTTKRKCANRIFLIKIALRELFFMGGGKWIEK